MNTNDCKMDEMHDSDNAAIDNRLNEKNRSTGAIFFCCLIFVGVMLLLMIFNSVTHAKWPESHPRYQEGYKTNIFK